jgi:hypothetical protein
MITNDQIKYLVFFLRCKVNFTDELIQYVIFLSKKVKKIFFFFLSSRSIGIINLVLVLLEETLKYIKKSTGDKSVGVLSFFFSSSNLF